MLELYHHGTSACAAKVRLALAEKNIAWQSRYVDILKGEQFSPEFLALNPKAVVPVLIHDGLVVRESTIICEYLEEVFPSPALYPASPAERVQARLWTKAVDEELHPACSAITYVVSHRHTILRSGVASFAEFAKRSGTEGAETRARKWAWIQHGLAAPGAADKIRLYASYLQQMDDALRDSNWLVANRFSIADVAMAPYVNRLAALSLERIWTNGRLPRVERWFDQLRARPAFQPAFVDWVPRELADEMRANGERSWPEIRAILALPTP